MAHINFEFKAQAANPDEQERKLEELNPVFKGEDHQKDTYYNVPKGRLKMREGNIENALIYYEREDNTDSKRSDVILYQHQPNSQLKAMLAKIHGVKVVVDKIRKIYFVNNVKIHFDRVNELGSFLEVEAIDDDGSIGIEKLKEQCNEFARFFGIAKEDFIAVSYSDMLLNAETNTV